MNKMKFPSKEGSTYRDDSSFDHYQEWAETTAVYQDNLYPVLALAEEAGELAGKFAKALRAGTNFNKEAVAKELGDVLWNVALIASELGMTLSDIAIMNFNKIESRKARGVINGEGDNR
ncbi:nucleoside triphosphate pyrophosphohydrolase family protein [Aeromonas veronii]|uniref:nucleoside triphosphate pyrophosphohydrolase family protein n=1 Tax=Aeromonas veronii TaxID=654 RepID=UPI003BA198A4